MAKSLDDALQGLSATASSTSEDDSIIDGCTVKVISSYHELKKVVPYFLRDLIINTIKQSLCVVDLSGIKEGSIPDAFKDVKLSVSYSEGSRRYGTNMGILVRQDGTPILYKYVDLSAMRSIQGSGLSDIRYDGDELVNRFSDADCIVSQKAIQISDSSEAKPDGTLESYSVMADLCPLVDDDNVPYVRHMQMLDHQCITSFGLVNLGSYACALCKELVEKPTFIRMYDYWQVKPNNILDAYPVVELNKRKGLYGLFCTTESGWPITDEEVLKANREYGEFLRSCIDPLYKIR